MQFWSDKNSLKYFLVHFNYSQLILDRFSDFDHFTACQAQKTPILEGLAQRSLRIFPTVRILSFLFGGFKMMYFQPGVDMVVV